MQLVLEDRWRTARSAPGRWIVLLHAIAGVVRAAPAEHARCIGQDLRDAVRIARKDATLTIAAVTMLALARLVQTQLYGVSAYDPATYAAAPAVLLLVGFFAAYLPSRRATRVNPVTALRHE